MTVRIYHNPRCSKSRQTLALLKERGVEAEIVEYLKTPPDADTLVDLAAQLGVGLRDLLRTGEDEYKQARKNIDGMDDGALASWLAANPKVLQRPIVVSNQGARIGRPPEAVLDILD
ncbi:MAG: arsenate reductase (glutaredoxin) [Chromatiales bacterium]|nr:MAG: arsenate reductase (glutaredoxin) [Chromatiales bacterium]